MKGTKRAGTARELQVVKAYREAGWIAFRTPASLGVCDVIAIRTASDARPDDPPAVRDWLDIPPRAEVIFAEVKATAGGPWERFGPAKRQALRDAAARGGARALLVHWPPHGARRDYDAAEWPS